MFAPRDATDWLTGLSATDALFAFVGLCLFSILAIVLWDMWDCWRFGWYDERRPPRGRGTGA